MYGSIIKNLQTREKPIDVIVVGVGFMGFGFISGQLNIPGVRVPLVISRRPKDAANYLREHGLKARVENKLDRINKNKEKNIISVSSDLDLVTGLKADVVLEMTGTIPYGTEVALKALN